MIRSDGEIFRGCGAADNKLQFQRHCDPSWRLEYRQVLSERDPKNFGPGLLNSRKQSFFVSAQMPAGMQTTLWPRARFPDQLLNRIPLHYQKIDFDGYAAS